MGVFGSTLTAVLVPKLELAVAMPNQYGIV